jgi:hypothetical protein
MVLMAELLLARGDVEGAEPLARQALAARKAGLPEDHRLVTWAQVLLADVLASRGDPVSAAQAEALAREAMQSYVDLGRATHWPFFEARSVLGASIAAQGRHDEAEPLLLESLEELERMQGPRGRAVRSALGRIIKLYERSGRGKRGDHYRNMLNAPRSP